MFLGSDGFGRTGAGSLTRPVWMELVCSRALWTIGCRLHSRPVVLSAVGCFGGLTVVATLAHELWWT